MCTGDDKKIQLLRNLRMRRVNATISRERLHRHDKEISSKLRS